MVVVKFNNKNYNFSNDLTFEQIVNKINPLLLNNNYIINFVCEKNDQEGICRDSTSIDEMELLDTVKLLKATTIKNMFEEYNFNLNSEKYQINIDDNKIKFGSDLCITLVKDDDTLFKIIKKSTKKNYNNNLQANVNTNICVPIKTRESFSFNFTSTNNAVCALQIAIGNINPITSELFEPKLLENNYITNKQPDLKGFFVKQIKRSNNIVTNQVCKFTAVPVHSPVGLENQLIKNKKIKKVINTIQINLYPKIISPDNIYYVNNGKMYSVMDNHNYIEANTTIKLFKCGTFDSLYSFDKIRNKTPNDYNMTIDHEIILICDNCTEEGTEIFCKGVVSETQIFCAISNSVIYFKQLLEEKKVMTTSFHRLVYLGKQMINHKTLGEHYIFKGSTIYIISSLRGGMFHSSSSRTDYGETNQVSNLMQISCGTIIEQKIVLDTKQPNYYCSTPLTCMIVLTNDNKPKKIINNVSSVNNLLNDIKLTNHDDDKCSICSNEFNEVKLNCGHYMCLMCFDQIIQSGENSNELKCQAIINQPIFSVPVKCNTLIDQNEVIIF